MKNCLLRGDFGKLHGILRSNWAAKKRMAANISNDLIERLYARALPPVLTAARSPVPAAEVSDFPLPIPRTSTRWRKPYLQSTKADSSLAATSPVGALRHGGCSLRSHLRVARLGATARSKEASMEAIILAGGLGTRLAARLNGIPKPMALVCGHPFLEYILARLRLAGCSRALLSVGHLGAVIQGHFGSSYCGMPIDYVVEALAHGNRGSDPESFVRGGRGSGLVLNGDTFVELGFTDLVEFHREVHANLTLTLSYSLESARYGRVSLVAITSGHLKPRAAQVQDGLTRASTFCPGLSVGPARSVAAFPLNGISLGSISSNSARGPTAPMEPFVDIGVPGGLGPRTDRVGRDAQRLLFAVTDLQCQWPFGLSMRTYPSS